MQIEVQNLDEMEAALTAHADVIMLDNFSISELEQAVSQNQSRAKLEASGGIEDGQLVKIAETGVDYISVGGTDQALSGTRLVPANRLLSTPSPEVLISNGRPRFLLQRFGSNHEKDSLCRSRRSLVVSSSNRAHKRIQVALTSMVAIILAHPTIAT